MTVPEILRRIMMEENNLELSKENGETLADKTEKENKETPKIEVKFNKEIRELTTEEATNLAQMGLKYEQIENDFLRLKTLAKNSGKSVDEYLKSIENETKENHRKEIIEQSGGNKQLADYVLSLEDNAPDNDFEELRLMFPDIKEKEELPKEVIEYSDNRGKNLLDSFLRYLYENKRKENENNKRIKAVNFGGIGSLKTGSSSNNTASKNEFIKGIWNK